jgi:hypothetical protein
MELPMTIREYARHRGVSHTAVRKAIASGRIDSEPDGTIDPAQADAMWESRTRKDVEPRVGPKPTGGPDYHQARAVKETYAAKLAKLEYEIKTGKLLPKDEVDVCFFNRARELRDRIQMIPRRVAARLAAETDPRTVEEILDSEIREALVDLSTPPHERLVNANEAR